MSIGGQASALRQAWWNYDTDNGLVLACVDVNFIEKKVDKLSEGAHENFRLFLSAEPPPALEKGLPISLLQNSIKLANEPTTGFKENLVRAYNLFSDEYVESCAKPAEFRTIIFNLSYFHSSLLERKKYGVGNLPT